MENREGVRTCVTCELIEEKSKEGSRRVAEVPLGMFLVQALALVIAGKYLMPTCFYVANIK